MPSESLSLIHISMLVAAMESAAFYETDIQKLIEIGLSHIPENTRMAKAVKTAVKLYNNKTDFKEAREIIVKETADMGWFQAPENVAFAIMGLLYGEGDFKKSVIYAINCGDDTDCTGATVGALLGIINGMKGIPNDWAEYIGDSIISVAIDNSYLFRPKSCTELTQRIYELVPSALKAYGIFMEYTDGKEEREQLPSSLRCPDLSIPSTGLALNFPDMIFAKGRVEFSACEVKAGGELELKFVFRNTMPDPKQIDIELKLPEGWTSDGRYAKVFLREMRDNIESELSIKLYAAQDICLKNIIHITASAFGRPAKASLDVVIWSKNQ